MQTFMISRCMTERFCVAVLQWLVFSTANFSVPFSPGLSHHVVQASCESGGTVGRGLVSTRESSHPFLLLFPPLFLLFSTPYLKSNPTWDLGVTCQPLFPKPKLNSFPWSGALGIE